MNTKPHLLGGFGCDTPLADIPELLRLGESWAHHGHRIGDHRHELWEVYLQIDGQTHWESGGHHYDLRPGLCYLVQPGQRHRLISVAGDRHHFCWAVLDLWRLITERETALRSTLAAGPGFLVAPAPFLHDPLRCLIAQVLERRRYQVAAARTALMHLAMVICQIGGDREILLQRDPRIDSVLAAMRAEPALSWRIADLATLAGLGRSTFLRRFAHHTGSTPHAWLLAHRLELVKERLLQTRLSITAIALDCGFDSSQHLANTFRAATGQSPSSWRRHNTSENPVDRRQQGRLR